MYDIIVIGGGHAGVEASLASARMNLNTLLITGNIHNMASMPCNPSFGGPAKGIVVREIDALGGEMARNIDKSHIQMRMLNTGKGPAVRALRAQADKRAYPRNMIETVLNQENLTVIEGMVEDLIVEDQKVKGVVLENGDRYYAKAVILTTGTYMKSRIMISSETRFSGPNDEKYSKSLSDNLRRLGFKTLRLKTGTPPRVAIDSVDYSKTEIQPGDLIPWTFSFDTKNPKPVEEQVPCYLTYTTEETHRIILENLSLSSMYGALEDVSSVGPKYCPSIEDKVVRFRDKPRHQIFLEPEGLEIPEIYIQGLSMSLPRDVQERIVHSIPGLEKAKIVRYAYAIEYDAIDPTQLYPTLESKLVENLYFAGQVNGTSGYEEAAGQGIMAGINAALKIKGEEPLILGRNEAYIGVMIDDLVTKGVTEPYRLLTSRAEYRLLLRHDNADLRLREYGYRVGLIDEARYRAFKEKVRRIEEEKGRLAKLKIYPTEETNRYLASIGSSPLKDGIMADQLLKRPEITFKDIVALTKTPIDLPYEVIEQIEIQIKYEGYIKKTLSQVEKMKKLEEKKIPLDLDFYKIPNLANEAKQQLSKIRPLTIGQAQRVPGVNPADISILLVYLESYYRKERNDEPAAV